MRITKHKNSHIVELEDGSEWRIWPGDLARTLHWMPWTRLVVHQIDAEFCTHALFDRLHGTCVRVIDASETWISEKIEPWIVSCGSPVAA
jgi:hypothetical protein